MTEGRAELELFLDDRAAIAAGRAIDRTMAALGDRMSAVARLFDQRFESAFSSVSRDARQSANQIEREFRDAGDRSGKGFLGTFGAVFTGTALGSLAAEAARQVARATIAAGSFAITQGGELTASQRALASAIRETGGAYGQAAAEAERFARRVGVRDADANRIFAGASIVTAGTTADTGQFVQSAADLLAARGRSLTELQTTVEQVIAGSDEGVGRLLNGINPSQIYERYAESIGKSAAALSDLEQRQAVVNAIMQAGAIHAGAAGERLGTLAGAAELLLARFDTLAGKAGQAIERNAAVQAGVRHLSEWLDRAAGSGGNFERTLTELKGPLTTTAALLIETGTAVAILGTALITKVRVVDDLLTVLTAGTIAGMARGLGQIIDLTTYLASISIQSIQTVTRGLRDLSREVSEAARAWPEAFGGRHIANAFDGISARLSVTDRDLERVRASIESTGKGFSQTSHDVASNFGNQAVRALKDIPVAGGQALSTLDKILRTRKQLLDNVNLAGTFTPPAKPIEDLAAAAALATKQFDELKGRVSSTVDEIQKLQQTRLTATGAAAELEARARQIEAGPNVRLTRAPDGREVLQVLDDIKESESDRLRRILAVRNDFLKGTSVPVEVTLKTGIDLLSGSSTLTGAGRLAGGTGDQTRAEAARLAADKYLVEQLAGSSASMIREAGLQTEYLESLRRIAQTERAEAARLKFTEDENARLLNDVLKAAKGLAETLNIDSHSLLEAARRFASEGLKVTNEITINSEEVFSVDVADGSAAAGGQTGVDREVVAPAWVAGLHNIESPRNHRRTKDRRGHIVRDVPRPKGGTEQSRVARRAITVHHPTWAGPPAETARDFWPIRRPRSGAAIPRQFGGNSSAIPRQLSGREKPRARRTDTGRNPPVGGRGAAVGQSGRSGTPPARACSTASMAATTGLSSNGPACSIRGCLVSRAGRGVGRCGAQQSGPIRTNSASACSRRAWGFWFGRTWPRFPRWASHRFLAA